MNNNTLGKRLKKLRTEIGLTQEEFGKPYNLKKSTISQYESGTSRPDDELKKSIAKDYDVSVDWLLGLTDIRNPYKKDQSKTKVSHSLDIEGLSNEAIEEVKKYIELIKLKYNQDKTNKK